MTQRHPNDLPGSVQVRRARREVPEVCFAFLPCPCGWSTPAVSQEWVFVDGGDSSRSQGLTNHRRPRSVGHAPDAEILCTWPMR